jgi:hypothetical protein
MEMHLRRRRTGLALALLALLLAGLAGSGCIFMTPHGQPVVVERTTQGDIWDGNGMLVERTADGRMCKVAIRDSLGIVVTRWFDCQHVHRRMN